MPKKSKPPSTSPSRGIYKQINHWFRQQLKKLFKFKLECVEELKNQLDNLHHQGQLSHDNVVMINGALSIAEMKVADIMVPKSSMQALSADAELWQVVEAINASLHSRYPVIDDNDQAIGVIFVKDIITFLLKVDDQSIALKNKVWTARSLMRPVDRVPETMNLAILLRKFRSGRNHMVIAIDEFGEVVGLITIEDVLEQIVGEIRDEHDAEETIWILHHDNHSTVKASTPIDIFNENFNTHFESDLGETIASIITRECDRLPKQGEQITLGDLSIKILKVDNRRLHLISVYQKDSDPPVNESVRNDS